jgi:hypothetical protein
MTTCFQIQRKLDHLVFAPKWGATCFKKKGKSYATAGHARSAWKNSQGDHKRDDVELVEFKTVEVRREAL